MELAQCWCSYLHDEDVIIEYSFSRSYRAKTFEFQCPFAQLDKFLREEGIVYGQFGEIASFTLDNIIEEWLADEDDILPAFQKFIEENDNNFTQNQQNKF